MQVFDIEPGSCLRVSAKTGMGLDQVLPAIIEGVPHPVGNERGLLRMLLFDAVHDDYRCPHLFSSLQHLDTVGTPRGGGVTLCMMTAGGH